MPGRAGSTDITQSSARGGSRLQGVWRDGGAWPVTVHQYTGPGLGSAIRIQ